MPKVKRTKRAQVFCVPSGETESGKHEVIYARDGDLNAAVERGNIKRFRKWDDAEGFAHKKGKELNAVVTVHSYWKNPSYTTKYQRVSQHELPKRKIPRVTPKTPRLRR